MRRTASLLIALALVLGACGDDDATPTSAESTTTDVSHIEVPVYVDAQGNPLPGVIESSTTTTSATTTTTVAASTTVTLAPTTTVTLVVSPVPEGSGCTPPGNVLPDGDWYGFIEGIDLARSEVLFDLVCYFEQAQADIAASADGYATPLEFYPYVRNQNPLVFELTIARNAIHENWQGVEQPFTTWVAAIPNESGCSPATTYRACLVAVRIDNGVLVRSFDPLPEWAGAGRDG